MTAPTLDDPGRFASYVAGLLDAEDIVGSYTGGDYWGPAGHMGIESEIRYRVACLLADAAKAHPEAFTYVVIAGLVEGQQTRYMITVAGPVAATGVDLPSLTSIEAATKQALETQRQLLASGYPAIISDGPAERRDEEFRMRVQKMREKTR